MSDFFEKLKKGMDSDDVNPVEDFIEEDVIEEEPIAEFTSVAIDPEPLNQEEEEIKPKTKKKKKTVKKKAVEVEEVSEPADFFDSPVGELTVDVYQSGNDLIIKSAIGGIESEDLDIVIENDFVVIKGSRPAFAEATAGREENVDYFFQECHWGSFKREIALPVEIDSSRAKAKLEKGILVIRMPIIEHKSKTKVSIE